VQSSTAGAVAGTAPVPNARTMADFGKAPSNALNGEGAVTTLSLVRPQRDVDGKWRALLDNFTNFSGREFKVDDRVYRADKPIMPRVLDMTRALGTQGRLLDDPAITADLYLRQSALVANAYDLAVMAATLANDGVNPVTRKTVVTAEVAKSLQLQLLANRKGGSAWMSKSGIPATAGIAGGIVVVIPGRLGLATYSPPLDSAGVSVRGQRAIKYLSHTLFLNP
jgi:glutaminase